MSIIPNSISCYMFESAKIVTAVRKHYILNAMESTAFILSKLDCHGYKE